jgi:hypothetical protein
MTERERNCRELADVLQHAYRTYRSFDECDRQWMERRFFGLLGVSASQLDMLAGVLREFVEPRGDKYG